MDRDVNNPMPAVFKEMKIPNLTGDSKPKKVIVIESCVECPSLCKRWNFTDFGTIHKDCPLQDYPDGGNL